MTFDSGIRITKHRVYKWESISGKHRPLHLENFNTDIDVTQSNEWAAQLPRNV